MTTLVRLADCVYAKDGQIRFSVPDGVLPGFLIEAYNATLDHLRGPHVRLGDMEIALADRMLAESWPGGRLAVLVLAIVFHRMGRFEEALSRYSTLTAIEPNALLFNQPAVILHGMGRFSEAVEWRKRALDLMPDSPALREAYSMDLIHAGFVREGLQVISELVDAGTVSQGVHSNLLFYAHCLPDMDQQRLLEMHRQWARSHAPARLAQARHPNDPDPDRRLRIGYLSADFHKHSANHMVEAMLVSRDPREVEVFGYGSVDAPDEVTDRFASMLDGYRPIYGLDDRTVADMIRQDQIDILVEVAGHTGGHRLAVMAYKPAPIQVDWGGINTTGMDQVDYRLTDRWFDPPETRPGYVETPIRLPGCVWRFTPLRDLPPVGPLPAKGNGCVTFGSFNGHAKINAYTMTLWAQVLHQCPGSRMLLKYRSPGDEGIRRRLCEEFERLGIASERIRVEGWQWGGRHWDLYSQVDLCLDTHPFSGCMTTLEALWMGVPVVTLAGGLFISRAGLSLLSCAGLGAFIATSPRQYVDKAVALAYDLATLGKLRQHLRQVMASGPLHDTQAYARDLEMAYRRMWRQWCEKQIQNPESKIPKEESIITHPLQHGVGR